MASLGRLLLPHSILFMPGFSLLISTASFTCLSVASFPNTSLTLYSNVSMSQLCFSLQWRHKTELSRFIFRSLTCSFVLALALALLLDSPMYLSPHLQHKFHIIMLPLLSYIFLSFHWSLVFVSNGEAKQWRLTHSMIT